MKITILTPVYNDWKSASKLIEEINTIVKDLDAEFSLVIVMMHQLRKNQPLFPIQKTYYLLKS